MPSALMSATELEKYIGKLEKENKNLKLIQETNEKQIQNDIKERDELREEVRKLREDNEFLTRISKEYMEKENIVQITEFTGLYKEELKKENEKLKKENEELREYKSIYEQLCK